MIDPVTAALLSGLTVSTAKVASNIVEGAYAALKDILVHKLGKRSDAVEAISKLESKPDSEGRKAVVVEELTAANVSNIPELVEAARRLQTALEQMQMANFTHVQQATGSHIAQASGGSTAKVNVNVKP